MALLQKPDQSICLGLILTDPFECKVSLLDSGLYIQDKKSIKNSSDSHITNTLAIYDNRV